VKQLSLLLIAATVLNTLLSWPLAAQQPKPVKKDDAESPVAIRKVVSKTGADLNKEVTAKLDDNTEVRGFISEVHDDYFVIKTTSGVPYKLSYDRVVKLKVRKLSNEERGFVTAPSVYKKVIAGVAIGIGVVAIVAFACVASRRCEE
jgi:hypothetical protein